MNILVVSLVFIDFHVILLDIVLKWIQMLRQKCLLLLLANS